MRRSGIFIVIAVTIFLFLLLKIGFFLNVQNTLSDALYGKKPVLDNIVIIGIDDKSIEAIGRWPWPREKFSQLLKKLNESKVIGIDISFCEPSDPMNDSLLIDTILSMKSKVVLPIECYIGPDGKKNFRYPFYPLNQSIEKGYVNLITDSDGITRAINTNLSQENYPFSYVIAKKYMHIKPLKRGQRVLINYFGKPYSYKYYSFIDVLNMNDTKVFKNKIVLIGAVSPTLHDNYFVPVSDGVAMPGVEIHANLVQMFILGEYINPLPQWVTILIVFFLSLVVWLIVDNYNPLISISTSLFFIISFEILAIRLFDRGILFNLIYPPLSVILTHVSTATINYFSEKRQKKEIIGIFSKYVSKQILEKILKDPSQINLGGSKKKITILFSDIRNFTSLSEKMDPEKLVKFLNTYFNEMAAIIMDNNGVVDKYIGDAIMCFWGDPVEDPYQHENACKTALLMKKRLVELRKEWKNEWRDISNIDIGIGIHSGKAVIGNLGSKQRFDYTAIGDSVNLASRLEGLNKYYGTSILVSEDVYREVKDKFLFRKIDRVRVKGKEKYVEIYELLDKEDKKIKDIQLFEKALSFYFEGKFKKANEIFSKLKNDKTAQIFSQRCLYFLKNKDLLKKWDGVWTMKDK